ncbi:hypothetical protein B0A55_07211 [Friedmanniomyces simplex]|uniref:DUF6590 domain-containing protein n=1 Tax=Friedmanniomyces simplex TaxID=329884 RepID=A0A4U0XG37_9PEZI|nr:hypothetical protein B0A55_07211 [Friedmanniomyces simplex]
MSDLRDLRHSPAIDHVNAGLANFHVGGPSPISAPFSINNALPASRQVSAVPEPQVKSFVNPATGVRTTSASEPKQRITDPALFARNIRAHRAIYGTEGEGEHLYTSYRTHSGRFFAVGRAFLILWSEPSGETSSDVTAMVMNDVPPNRSTFTTGRYGDRVYSKARRFVVVRPGSNYCTALPIVTYGEKGVAKMGINKSEHAIIYTGRQPPEPRADELPNRTELGMRSRPIRLVPDQPTDKLDSMSRIDFGKAHTIQHNIKVKPLGMVHPSSMDALTSQFFAVWLKPSTILPRQALSPSHTSRTSRAQQATAASFSAGSNVRQQAAASALEEGNEDSDESSASDAEISEGGEQVQQDTPLTSPPMTARSQSTSTEAAQAQNIRTAMLALVQQGHSRDQAIEALVQRLVASNRYTRQRASAVVQARLSYDQTYQRLFGGGGSGGRGEGAADADDGDGAESSDDEDEEEEEENRNVTWG